MATSAAARSQHPDAGVAVGEVVGGVLERVEPHPGLAVLTVAGDGGRLIEIEPVVRALVAPDLLLAATVAAVVDGTGPVAPAVGLWVAHVPVLRAVAVTAAELVEPDEETDVAGDEEPAVALALTGPTASAAEALAAVRSGLASADVVLGRVAPGRRERPRLRVDGRDIGGGNGGVVGAVISGHSAEVTWAPVPPARPVDVDWSPEPGADEAPAPSPSPVNLGRGSGLLAVVDGPGLRRSPGLDLEPVFGPHPGSALGLVGTPLVELAARGGAGGGDRVAVAAAIVVR